MADDPHQDSKPAPELGEAAAHGIRWSAVSRPTVELLQLASMVVLARLIVPAEFGRFAVATIAVEIGTLIVGAGLSNALVQRKVADPAHLQAASALALSIGAFMTAATVAFAAIVIDPVFGGRTAELMYLLAPMCLITAFSSVPLAQIRRKLAFRRLSEIEIANTGARVLVAVALALAGMNGEALVLGVLAGTVTVSVIACASAPPPRPRFLLRPMRDLLEFALPMSLASLTWVGFSNVDYAVIGARLGAVQTGLYFRAYSIAVEYQSKLGQVMSQIGFPVLSRTEHAGQMDYMHRQMVRLLTIALFPLLVLLAITAPTLVPFVFGSNWSAASTPVQVLALGGAATVLIDAAGTVLMASGRPRAVLAFGAGHFLVYGVAVLLVAPLGITAVAVAAAVVHSAFVLVSYGLMGKGLSHNFVRRVWDDMAPALVSSIAMGAVAVPASLALTAAGLPALPWMLAIGLIGTVAYLLVLRFGFAAVWATERSIFNRIIPSRLRSRFRLRPAALGGGPSGQAAGGGNAA
ncbi:MAG TPA: oligosaccharide flippase family protein [Solirubrobacterales bacterium]